MRKAPSLRGVALKRSVSGRRSNPAFVSAKAISGLLRLRLAMTTSCALLLLVLGGCEAKDGDIKSLTSPVGPCPLLRGGVSDRVLFSYDSSLLSKEAQEILDKQAEWLTNSGKEHNIVVEGHADERGTREYNLALGERRAQAAKEYLVASGIAASRITTISYGKERPAVLGTGEESWSQNRRAVSALAQ